MNEPTEAQAAAINAAAGKVSEKLTTLRAKVVAEMRAQGIDEETANKTISGAILGSLIAGHGQKWVLEAAPLIGGIIAEQMAAAGQPWPPEAT